MNADSKTKAKMGTGSSAHGAHYQGERQADDKPPPQLATAMLAAWIHLAAKQQKVSIVRTLARHARHLLPPLLEISFHSLRHTATTLLKSAGVSDAVPREFIGHDSPTVSKHYTHIPTDTRRQAANKLPDIFK